MKFQITPQNGRLGGRVPSGDVTAGRFNVFRIINSWLVLRYHRFFIKGFKDIQPFSTVVNEQQQPQGSYYGKFHTQ